jgi:IBR domain, a half RING-finger domain
VFGSIFGPSKATPAPEPKVTCLTCLDDVLVSRTAKLDCGHRMCRTCLKRIFTMSVTDPAHMPPKCCTAECIPLKHVDKLFDTKFKVKWNRKYQEYTTANRLYCPSRGCGAWIRPKDIKADPTLRGRRYGKCARCRTKVCATCNNRWHSAKVCPHDEETKRFVDMAKEQGWQRCFNCQATVELKEGCNHMTCRCTAQFCMICGAKWKTCDCPWFNYAAVEADRVQHMNIAQVRRMALDPAAAAGLNRPRAYHEEMERRRSQERHDEAMARRMQGLDLDRHFATVPLDLRATPRRRRTTDDPAELDAEGGGGEADHDFIQRATALLTSPVTPGRAAAADRLVSEIRQHQSRQDRGTDSPSGTSTSRTSRRRPQSPHTVEVPATPRVVPGRGRAAERLVPRRAPGEVNYATQAPRLRPRRTDDDDDEDDEEEVDVQVRRSAAPKRKTTRDSKKDRDRDRGYAVETVKTRDKARGKGRERATVTVHAMASDDEEGGGGGSSSPSRPLPTPAATLAGLHRKSTQGRVDAWRRHVGPGLAGG